MKNASIVILASIIVLGTCAFAAEYTKFSSKFVKHFKDCDRYEETVVSEFEGKEFTTNRQIQGWKNGFCKYQEVIKSPSSEYQLNCAFTDVQVEELYMAMKNRSKEVEKYDLETFAEQKDLKTGKTQYVSRGTTTIKGNKAYIAWAKYQNNPYFCIPKKI